MASLLAPLLFCVSHRSRAAEGKEGGGIGVLGADLLGEFVFEDAFVENGPVELLGLLVSFEEEALGVLDVLGLEGGFGGLWKNCRILKVEVILGEEPGGWVVEG